MGMGMPIPDLSNLPGVSRPGGGGGGGAPVLAQIDNLNSMSFDGINDRISIPNTIIPLSGNSTVSFWFKTAVGYNVNDAILGSNVSLNFYPYLDATGGNIRILYRNGSVFTRVTTNVAFIQNTWFHISIVNDSTNVTTYVNGIGQTPNPVLVGGSDISITSIGAMATGSSYALNGNIDEVGIFNTALTDAEILSIYNATAVVGGVNKTADLSQLTTPPIAWYRM